MFREKALISMDGKQLTKISKGHPILEGKRTKNVVGTDVDWLYWYSLGVSDSSLYLASR